MRTVWDLMLRRCRLYIWIGNRRGILRAALVQARLAVTSRMSQHTNVTLGPHWTINTYGNDCDFRLDREHDVLLVFVKF